MSMPPPKFLAASDPNKKLVNALMGQRNHSKKTKFKVGERPVSLDFIHRKEMNNIHKLREYKPKVPSNPHLPREEKLKTLSMTLKPVSGGCNSFSFFFNNTLSLCLEGTIIQGLRISHLSTSSEIQDDEILSFPAPALPLVPPTVWTNPSLLPIVFFLLFSLFEILYALHPTIPSCHNPK